MDRTRFELVTDWTFQAPIEAVWHEIAHPEDWPSWWKAVRQVKLLKNGEANGLGAVRRFTWRTALPYRLAFDMEVTHLEPPHLLEGTARGELVVRFRSSYQIAAPQFTNFGIKGPLATY